MGIITDIFDEIDLVLDTYVIDTSTVVINSVTPIFTSLLIIWIAIWGYMLMYGKTESTLTDAFFKILRIGFILTLGLSVGTYSGVIVDFMFGWPEEVISWVTGNPSGNLSGAIDNLLDSLVGIVSVAWQKGGVFDGNIGFYFIAIIVGGFAVVIGVILAFLILLSKIVLSILLAVGPIFIMLLLFPTTQKFFESWMASLINYGFLLLLSVLVASVVISFTNTIMDGLGGAEGLANILGTIKLAIILLLSTLILRQIPQIAANLGGGIALQTSGAFSSFVNQSKLGGRGLVTTGRGLRAGSSLIKKGYSAARSRFGTGISKG